MRSITSVILLGAGLTLACRPVSGQVLLASLTEAQRALEYAVELDLRGRDEQAKANYIRAIQLNPHSSLAYDRYSLFLFARGKSGDGVTMLRKALSLNPQMLELRALLGMHLYRLGKIQQAYNELEIGIKKLARHDIYAVFARCAFLLERYPVAVTMLRKYLAERPAVHAKRDHTFKTQLALALMRMGSVKQADQQLQAVLSQHPKDLRAREARAELLLHMRRCAEAVRAYKKLISRAKAGVYSLKLASGYLCLGRHRDALTMADQYVASRRRYIAWLLGRKVVNNRYRRKVRRVIEGLSIQADAQMKLRSYERALAAYETIERLSGRTEKVTVRAATALFMMKQNDKVLERLADELKKPDTAPSILVLALRAAVRSRKRDTALRCADRLAGAKGTTPRQRYYAGVAYSSAGKFDLAVKQLEQALAGAPEHRWTQRELIRAYCYQGRRALDRGDARAAVEALRKAERLAPRKASIQQNMVIATLALGRGTRAVAHAKRLLRLKPKAVSSQRLMARALAAAGRHAKALPRYQAAQKGAATSPRLMARLLTEEAVSLIKTKQTREGISKLRRALRVAEPLGDEKLKGSILRILSHAQILHANDLLGRGKAREVQRVLADVSSKDRGLSPATKALVKTLTILAKIVTGQARRAKRLLRKHKAAVGATLRPAFAGVGAPLLEALADANSRSARARARGAARLEQLASKLPKPASDALRTQAGIVHHQLGVQAFRLNQRARAKKAFARAQRLFRVVSATFRHNKAIVDYYNGNKEVAIKSLYGAMKQTPLASCNVAVHFERVGDMRKAFELFKQCDKLGVRSFPNLKQILEIRRQLGEKAGS